MEKLLYASLALVAIVAITELGYLGDTSLAWVILALTTAIGLQALYLIKKSKNQK